MHTYIHQTHIYILTDIYRYTLASYLPGVPGRFRFLLEDAGFEVGLGIGFELGCGSWMNPLRDEERSSGDNIVLGLNLNKLQKELKKKLKKLEQ